MQNGYSALEQLNIAAQMAKEKDKLPLQYSFSAPKPSINIATIETEAFEKNTISVNKGLSFEVCSLKEDSKSRTTRGFKVSFYKSFLLCFSCVCSTNPKESLCVGMFVIFVVGFVFGNFLFWELQVLFLTLFLVLWMGFCCCFNGLVLAICISTDLSLNFCGGICLR